MRTKAIFFYEPRAPVEGPRFANGGYRPSRSSRIERRGRVVDKTMENGDSPCESAIIGFGGCAESE